MRQETEFDALYRAGDAAGIRAATPAFTPKTCNLRSYKLRLTPKARRALDLIAAAGKRGLLLRQVHIAISDRKCNLAPTRLVLDRLVEHGYLRHQDGVYRIP